jgi:predicted outer membrane repeat protein
VAAIAVTTHEEKTMNRRSYQIPGAAGLFLLTCAAALLLTLLGGTGARAASTLNVPTLLYPTIQAAINAAVNGDTVLVRNGTYTAPGFKNLDFGGKRITVRSENGPAVTIIDCQGAGRGFLFTSGETAAARVEGFTVRNGFIIQSVPGGRGAGMFISSSSPTVSNCTFTRNITASHSTSSGGGGSGIWIEGGSPTVSSCTFSGNIALGGTHTAQGLGGGMTLKNSSALVTNCTFSGNSAPGGSDPFSSPGGSGGGMFIWNEPEYHGGSPTVSNCTFSGNSVGYNSQSPDPTLRRGLGAGMYIASSNPAVSNCTFSGNSAAVGGGGIYVSGGGVFGNSSPAVSNCILWSNSPDEIATFSYTEQGTTLTVSFSDVQQQTGTFPGTGNINQAPQFVRNPSPGMDGVFGDNPATPMVNEAADDDYGDLHLRLTSPCIDAGSNAAVPADTGDLDADMDTAEPLPVDLDGNPRFVDDPAVPDTGSGPPPIVDMGPYEHEGDPLPAALMLAPAVATHPVGTMHCVTATVTDAGGSPTPNVTVRFAVTGSVTTGGSATTDAGGQAQFCYDGPMTPGMDTITAYADTDGDNVQDSGEPDGTATKTWVPGAPATLMLAPKTATNLVGTVHCVTATVTDAFGNPTPNVTVRFAVTGSVTAGGSATTNSGGQAQFCYTGPALPGTDSISAFADTDVDSMQDAGEPGDTASKSWVQPASTPNAKVTGSGQITAANGDTATFGVNAQVKGGTPKGEEEYQDHGPAQPLKVKSLHVQAVVCNASKTQASIFGTATINGGGSFNFRIDVRDLGEPGRSDTYRLRLSSGYDSGQQTLQGGNIQIH